jgi:signal peptidase II
MLEKKTWMIITYAIVILFASFDRLLKFLAAKDYFSGSGEIIGDILKLSFAKNYNIAFSIPFSGLILNIIIAFIILWLVGYFFLLISKDKYIQSVFAISVLLGAISNFYDRLKFGYVIDYLDLKYFTVFNLADAMIVLGVLGVGWMMVYKKE